MAEATLNAVADHGVVSGDTVRLNYTHAKQVLDDLAAVGNGYADVVQVLEAEAVDKFEIALADVTDRLSWRLTDVSGAAPSSKEF